MTGQRNLRLATTGSMLAIALIALPESLPAQTASSEVGIVLSKEGEIYAIRQSREIPLKAYSVVQDGMSLRLAPKTLLRLAHNRERATYVIAGPAVVAISLTGLTAEPPTAIVSRTGSRLPVELAAPGAAAAPSARSNLRVGGESLESTRAGLAASVKSAEAPKAEAPNTRTQAVSAKSRSERERLADEEAARKALSSAKSKAPTQVAASTSAPAIGATGESEVLYQQAVALERSGKAVDAVRIYRRAARAGSGKAALRLAEIFDRGVPGVSRDYAESLQWYQTAQQLGEKVPAAAAR